MSGTIETIPLSKLSVAFIPVIAVIFILYKWSLRYLNGIYAVSRMLVQLLIIGYFLAFIFQSNKFMVVGAVLAVMVFSSSWIALGTVPHMRKAIYLKCFIAILIGGGLNLILVTTGVLNLDPWYLPRFTIPLAGMIFANAMTSVSLAAERLSSEMRRGESYLVARQISFQASLIPIVNSLFAVGLVSLPGMMTGQILSGISPLIAARYQIMVMCMLFGSSGMATAIFLTLTKDDFQKA